MFRIELEDNHIGVVVGVDEIKMPPKTGPLVDPSLKGCHFFHVSLVFNTTEVAD